MAHGEQPPTTSRFSNRLGHSRWHVQRVRVVSYLFISPFYLLFLLFGAFPTLFTFFLALTEWNGFEPVRFIGFRNFQSLLHDNVFWASLTNTLIFWLGHIPPLFALSFLAAVALNSSKIRGRRILQSIYFLPQTVPAVPMALAFGLLFDQNYGLVNALLIRLGIPAVPWLGHHTWAKVAVMTVNVWWVLGWYMVIFLAALQNIDPALYEAAVLDGASTFHCLVRITIPLTSRVLFFAFVFETIGSFRIFTEPYILTRFGPADATLPMLGYLYRSAFEHLRLGYAATIGTILFSTTAFVSLLSAWMWRRAS
jgi:ABC-type sugar transport system permease subunit